MLRGGVCFCVKNTEEEEDIMSWVSYVGLNKLNTRAERILVL